jgi:hypothetical protein
MRLASLVPVIALVLTSVPAWPQAPSADPGPQHAALAGLAGEYDATTSYYWKPGDPPEVSKGVSVFTAVLGGRFLMQQDYAASGHGEPSGIRLFGFNAAAGKYEATWSYDRSTGLLAMTGTSPDGGRTIEFKGRWEEGAGTFRALNATLTKRDDGTFSIHLTGERGSDPRVETVFTPRRKSRLESDVPVRAVAERLVLRRSAPAQGVVLE